MEDTMISADFRAWTETAPKVLRNTLVRAEDVYTEYLSWCEETGTHPICRRAVGRCMKRVFPATRSMQMLVKEEGTRIRHYHNGERKPFVDPPVEDDLLDI